MGPPLHERGLYVVPPPPAAPGLYPDLTALKADLKASDSAAKPKASPPNTSDPSLSLAVVKVPKSDDDSDLDGERDPDYDPGTRPDPPPGPWTPGSERSSLAVAMAWQSGPEGVEVKPPDVTTLTNIVKLLPDINVEPVRWVSTLIKLVRCQQLGGPDFRLILSLAMGQQYDESDLLENVPMLSPKNDHPENRREKVTESLAL
ncbi:hypothetical protein SRHO_G00327120 [Serrasalmus rhombeus]